MPNLPSPSCWGLETQRAVLPHRKADRAVPPEPALFFQGSLAPEQCDRSRLVRCSSGGVPTDSGCRLEIVSWIPLFVAIDPQGTWFLPIGKVSSMALLRLIDITLLYYARCVNTV